MGSIDKDISRQANIEQQLLLIIQARGIHMNRNRLIIDMHVHKLLLDMMDKHWPVDKIIDLIYDHSTLTNPTHTDES